MLWCSLVIRVPVQGQLETKPHMHQMGDVMTSNAAKQQANVQSAAITTGFDSETIIANNDVIERTNGQSIEALRSKIKASRLEKLMARQLESELSLAEIAFEPSLDDLDLSLDEPSFEEPQTTIPSRTQSFLPNRQRYTLSERSSEIDPRSRFKSNRHDCESLLQEF